MRNTARQGFDSLDNDSRDRIVEFVISRLNPDGGFRGRSSRSDLYYTYFGLECLTACGHPFPDNTPEYLDRFGDGETLDLVHLTSLIRSIALLDVSHTRKRVRDLVRRLGVFRTASYAFSLTKEKPADSVYAGFLAFLAHEEAGMKIKKPGRLVSLIEDFRSRDGAFADRPGLDRGTTTVTAAVLALTGALGRPDRDALAWLKARMKHGGFLAGSGAPTPDLLSTATALFALKMADLADIDAENTFSFIETCWREDGGFAGHLLDETSDCEYTFYALLTLGCIAKEEACCG